MIITLATVATGLALVDRAGLAARDGAFFALVAGLAFFLAAALLVDLATETPTPFMVRERHLRRSEMVRVGTEVKAPHL